MGERGHRRGDGERWHRRSDGGAGAPLPPGPPSLTVCEQYKELR